MLGRRTYQNNFSSNSVVTVVVEKTISEIPDATRFTSTSLVSEQNGTTFSLAEPNRNGFGVGTFGDYAYTFSIINGRAKFVQEPFLKAGGSDANGRMVVNSPAGSLHPSVMCYAPEGGQNYVVSIEFF
jgi:hypothetical protein